MKRLFILITCGILFAAEPITINENIQLFHISDSTYLHYSLMPTERWGPVGCNGIVHIKNGQVLLLDSPCNDEQTGQLVDYLTDSMNVTVTHFIAGHYHDDCMGGIGVLHARGVESIACHLTEEKCREYNLPIPKTIFDSALDLDFQGESVQIRYPGGGHTIDNIVVWFPNTQILFGGCLVKALSSRNLGNTRNAVVEQWAGSIQWIQSNYPEAEIIVPGHGRSGGPELLDHTIKLVYDHLNKK